MPLAKIGLDSKNLKTIEVEVARLRDLDLTELRARWRTAFRRRHPPHLPRHLLLRVLAYQFQAYQLGDLDSGSLRLLENNVSRQADGRRLELKQHNPDLRPGTVLNREWNGQVHRIAVTTEGFSWNGKTYRSLSKVAFEITGTRWNGPRFFGLRNQLASGPNSKQ